MPGDHSLCLIHEPGFLSPEQLRAQFVVRQAQLQELSDQVRAASGGRDVPQHVLVVGQAGMGKTMLLRRLAQVIGDDPELSGSWLPLRLPELLPGLGDLADLWLAALEALALSLADGARLGAAASLGSAYPDPAAREEAARRELLSAADALGRKLLLLVEDLGQVLDRIDGDVEASRLRETLQHQPELMLVGSASGPLAQVYDYRSPFYEMFRQLELPPLSDEEFLQVVERSRRGRDPDPARSNARMVRMLGRLAGGSVRSAVLLGQVLAQLPGAGLQELVEGFVGAHSAVYRCRLGQLPRQAQRALDALALGWDPATADQVAAHMGCERGAASGQLHVLEGKGWAQKVSVPGRALGFQLRDRLFNIWYLRVAGGWRRRDLAGFLEFAELLQQQSRGWPGPPSELDGAEPEAGLLQGLRDRHGLKWEEYLELLAGTAATLGPEWALVARTLVRQAPHRHVGEVLPRIVMAQIELSCQRHEAALEQLGGVLKLDLQRREMARVTTLLLELAREGRATAAHNLLAGAARPERWAPLRHALAVQGGIDDRRLERLAPEMRAAAEQVWSWD